MGGSNAKRTVVRRLAALALAWPCACLAVGFVPPDTAEPQPPSPTAEFDTVFQRVVGPASLDASTPDYERAHSAVMDAIISWRNALFDVVAAYEAKSQADMETAIDDVKRAEDAYAVAIAFFY